MKPARMNPARMDSRPTITATIIDTWTSRCRSPAARGVMAAATMAAVAASGPTMSCREPPTRA
ncbi:hypothetical protein D3C73_1488030 [compost metagenome]